MESVSIKTSILQFLLNRAERLGMLRGDSNLTISRSVSRTILVPSHFYIDLVECNKELSALVKTNEEWKEYMNVQTGRFLPYPMMKPNPFAAAKLGQQRQGSQQLTKNSGPRDAAELTEQLKSGSHNTAALGHMRQKGNREDRGMQANRDGPPSAPESNKTDSAALGLLRKKLHREDREAQDDLQSAPESDQTDAAALGLIRQKRQSEDRETQDDPPSASESDNAASSEQGVDANLNACTQYNNQTWTSTDASGSRWAQMPAYQLNGDPYGIFHQPAYSNWVLQPAMAGQTMMAQHPMMLHQGPMSTQHPIMLAHAPMVATHQSVPAPPQPVMVAQQMAMAAPSMPSMGAQRMVVAAPPEQN